MKAPVGHYRKLISDSNIRIAFTHTPIIECTVVNNTKVIEELEKSNDEFASYYIEGLKNGDMVTVVENSHYEKHYKNNGELFFTS